MPCLGPFAIANPCAEERRCDAKEMLIRTAVGSLHSPFLSSLPGLLQPLKPYCKYASIAMPQGSGPFGGCLCCRSNACAAGVLCRFRRVQESWHSWVFSIHSGWNTEAAGQDEQCPVGGQPASPGSEWPSHLSGPCCHSELEVAWWPVRKGI